MFSAMQLLPLSFQGPCIAPTITTRAMLPCIAPPITTRAPPVADNCQHAGTHLFGGALPILSSASSRSHLAWAPRSTRLYGHVQHGVSMGRSGGE